MSLDMQTPSGAAAPPRSSTRVVITGSCDGLAELHESLAGYGDLELSGWCTNVHDAAGLLASDAQTVVLHATRSAALPEAELETLREQTQAPIVLLVADDSAELFEQALDAGVADVLVLPQPAEKVAFTIQKAVFPSSRHPVEELPDTHDRIVRPGQVFAVLGPKGGSGKSVLATNLAATLSRHHAKRTLLVDLDLQFGDAALMLGSEPEKTIYDLVAAPGELDAEKLRGYTTRHPSGLDLLPAPLRPEDAELVTEEGVAAALAVARFAYDAVVIDTSASFSGATLAALDATDELLLVCGLDLATLKDVRLTLRTLELLSFPRERIRLVLNQPTPSRVIKRKELEAGLDAKVRLELPYDSDVPEVVSRGELPVLNGRVGFARAVREVAASLVSTNGKRGRWPALRRA
jgi:pilus assembly protein CpaE